MSALHVFGEFCRIPGLTAGCLQPHGVFLWEEPQDSLLQTAKTVELSGKRSCEKFEKENRVMSKSLVAYFSASGVTAKLAKKLAAAIHADLHEIRPEQPYTQADLDWTNKNSRSSVEMQNKSFRPPIANAVEHMDQYDTVFVAFPIWWYVAPTIINSFLEQYDLTGKTIVPLATSGSSGMGDTCKELAASCRGAVLKEGKRFPAGAGEAELKSWAETLLK